MDDINHTPPALFPPSHDGHMSLQSDTRPISQDQLIAEVKGIYAGLVTVKSERTGVDTKQAKQAECMQGKESIKLSDNQWQITIAGHRTSFHEHHVSQHPAASPAVGLRRPDFHSLFDAILVLSFQDSLDDMLVFAYLCYSIQSLLFEAVDMFEETWGECSGDLGRCRITIDDRENRGREFRSNFWRRWRVSAAGKIPQVGRLYHHLAILAGPSAIQQLFYYTKSLSVSQPYRKEPVVFEPLFRGTQYPRRGTLTTPQYKAHAYILAANMPNVLQDVSLRCIQQVGHCFTYRSVPQSISPNLKIHILQNKISRRGRLQQTQSKTPVAAADWRNRAYQPLTHGALPTPAATSQSSGRYDEKTRRAMREGVQQASAAIHDAKSAREYSRILKTFADKFPDDAVDLSRQYLQTPRAPVGWNGLTNDPDIDSSFNINKRLPSSRQMGRAAAKMAPPVRSEMIDSLTPQALVDLIDLGSIGPAKMEAQLRAERDSGWLAPIERAVTNSKSPRGASEVEPVCYSGTDIQFPMVDPETRKSLLVHKKRALGKDIITLHRPFQTRGSSRQHVLQRAKPSLESGRGTIRKRGLEGLVNGNFVYALPDTGSDENIVSESFIEKHNLHTTPSSQEFRLGNSTTVRSKGTVAIHWAFADNPGKKYPILCQVLPGCLYDLILGKSFEKAVETYSRYRRRLTQCAFSLANVFRVNLIGNAPQRLVGILGSKHRVFAVPDTGAECNVMDADFARRNNYRIDTSPYARNHLQFANGSIQETIGQVSTNWTFADGTQILVRFEVLENCAADVVLGEEIIYQHNLFETYASSITEVDESEEPYLLAPFGFLTSWQAKITNVAQGATAVFRKSTDSSSNTASNDIASTVLDTEREACRRQAWNQQFDFGTIADQDEKQAERNRRKDFDDQLRRTEAIMMTARPPADSRNRRGRIPTVRILGRGEERA